MRIANNVPALNAFNSLNSANNNLQKMIKQVSTGLRINSAADDAAGLAISENMRAQSTGLERAIRNAQDGISLLQTAEGALGETNSMLQRMRELAVQAANDTLTSQDRNFLQMEIDNLKDSINRTTAGRAERSITLLDEAIKRISVQRSKIGAYENALEHTIENLTTSNTNLIASESRIRDADMSKSMLDLVKYQIIHQSGTSMLAQANQLPQSVLNLLQ